MSDVSRQTRYSSLSLQEIVGLCADRCDQEAWEEFVSRVGKPINMTLSRTAARWTQPSRALVQDLAQVTFLKLWEGGRRLLHEFALRRPDAILAYVKRIAANAAHDHFKHENSQSLGGQQLHVSTSDIDPEAGNEIPGSPATLNRDVFLQQVDEILKRRLAGPDAERDRTIFWLYFRQGMSTQEIASLPSLDLSAKGVGSVIERLKHVLREEILGGEGAPQSTNVKSKSLGKVVIGIGGVS
jgi:RNA polymerase sigma-70 factor (ECF subfamily)